MLLAFSPAEQFLFPHRFLYCITAVWTLDRSLWLDVDVLVRNGCLTPLAVALVTSVHLTEITDYSWLKGGSLLFIQLQLGWKEAPTVLGRNTQRFDCSVIECTLSHFLAGFSPFWLPGVARSQPGFNHTSRHKPGRSTFACISSLHSTHYIRTIKCSSLDINGGKSSF